MDAVVLQQLNGDILSSPENGISDPNVKKRLSVERIYQKKTQLEHILLRPDSYIGSTLKDTQQMWVLDESQQHMICRDITFSPGLYKIFDEILVNAADNKVRDPTMSCIKIDINPAENMVRIWNDGKGIPVVHHKVENVYVPTLIFGHLLTSSNYDDTERKVTGGRNGYGAKLCNIFSKKFIVETSSKEYKKSFRQVWVENMTKTSEPKILADKGDDFTSITFYPDLARFGMSELEPDTVSLFTRRAYDMAATCNGVKVFLNGKRLPIKGFVDYVNLFIKPNKDDAESVKVVYEAVNPRWQVAVAVSNTGFQQVSFVNSIATTKGGTHITYVSDQIVNKLMDIVKKKSGKSGVQIKPFQIKNHMWLFVNCLIENPTFDSQTKENMTLQIKSFGSTCALSEKFIGQASKSGIVENVLSWIRFKAMEKMDKQCHKSKHSKLKGIPKLDDANNAGTKNSSQCTLILTEGDSAKTLAVAGLGVVGRDNYGVFPLRGKLLNVREASNKQIMENAEINALIKILGLQYKLKYESMDTLKDLRYGKIMIMTDQDQDGSHIKGLIINFVHCNWPNLLKHNVVEEFITPIVKVFKGKQEQSFYSLPEFEEWQKSTPNWHTWRVKYYKGLGTSTSKEAKEYFSDMNRHRIRFRYSGDEDDGSIQLAFDKSKIADRKNWLTNFTQERKRRRELGLPEPYLYGKDTRAITYHDFVHKELVLFSNLDNERSIPSVVDGLKPGQRKVLFTCLKRNLIREIKVAQLAGSVAELSAYHHGEQSLMSTIIGLAQNFVGSNNLNLLQPIGQFGTRLSGGKDAASPRYIFTALNSLTRLIFHLDDDPLLNYLYDDNQRIEPEWYAPIIPMVLVNGADGIGTGYATHILNYDVTEIINNLYRMLDGEEPRRMLPSFRGFTGTIEDLGSNRYVCYGEVAVLDDDTLEITELPIRTWTQNYKESVLEPMLNGSEKVPACITDYKEYHTDVTVRFVVKMSPEKLREAESTGLHKFFKLQTVMSTGSMVCFDPLGCLKCYSDEMVIIREFFELRLTWYEKRKIHLEGVLSAEAKKLENQARFVLEKIQSIMVIENKPKKELIRMLKEANYDSDPVKAWKESIDKVAALQEQEEAHTDASTSQTEAVEAGQPDYNYILNMPLWSLTKERKDDLLAQRDAKQRELSILRSKSPSDLWREDLKKLEEEYKKAEAELAADERAAIEAAEKKLKIASATTAGRAAATKSRKLATETRPDPMGRRVVPAVDADIMKKVEGNKKKRNKTENELNEGNELDNSFEVNDEENDANDEPKPLIQRLGVAAKTDVQKTAVMRGRGKGRTVPTSRPKPQKPSSPNNSQVKRKNVGGNTKRKRTGRMPWESGSDSEGSASHASSVDSDNDFISPNSAMHLSSLHCGERYLKWQILLISIVIIVCLQQDFIESKHHQHKRHKEHGNKCNMIKHKCLPPIYTYGPCYRGVSLKKVVVFTRNHDCVCVPFVYKLMKQCPCGSPAKIIYACPNKRIVKSYVYQKRVNGRCKKFPLKRRHVKNCTIRYIWKKTESKINRKKRSAQLHTSSGSKCGLNQHYVPERNPCPETCEGKFFGVESRCNHLISGPGCECLPGYMRDGILCVPPSQCGCLESVCIDRAPTEKCKLWRAEGRCYKDKAIMQRFCRATCQRCERPCEDQIATSQCELIKRRGECSIGFYKAMCMLTCSQQNCRCPKCHIESGPCHPITKNIELRHICYQLQSNGSCKALITRKYRPCGDCPARILRIPGKCNYCKGSRDVVIRTYFREEIGLKRCLMIERSHEEKCACEQINLMLKTCQANKIPVIKTMVRVQTSCDKCVHRKINVLGKPIECKKTWIKRGKCEQTHPGQIGLTRKVIYSKEVAKNCKCQLISHEETEICGCPRTKRSNPFCMTDRNQLAIKITYYKPNRTHCLEYTNISWIPKLPCPPADQTLVTKNLGRFHCNPETCERTWIGRTWIHEHCKCRQVDVNHPAGKCCCPKPESSQSDCQNGLSDVTNITYSLVNGDCKRHVFRSVVRCYCPNSENFVKCDSENGVKLFGTIKYEIQKDGTCRKVELIEMRKINCIDEDIRRISDCNVRITEDNRVYRQLLVVRSKLKRCECTTVKPKVHLEACICPEAQTNVVKQIKQCPSWCFNATPETCDQRCQNIFIWQKFVYDSENPGRCRTEILQKVIKPCCCKRSKQIRQLCSEGGKTLIIESEERLWKDDQCIKKVKRIHQPIQCKIGLLKETLTNPQKHGNRFIQSVYGYREQCQCKIRVEEKLCNQSCPKPVYEVECDSASRELLHKQTDYVNIACSCRARIYKRRTKVFCPQYTTLISSYCSPITSMETNTYKTHFQDGCQCKESVIVKTRRCACPKDRISEKQCDASNNKLISIRIHYELLDGNCLPQKDVIEEPVSCDEQMKMEIRRNNGRQSRQLLCHRPTGLAQIVTHIWVPKNCKCVRAKQVIREGLCNCPKSYTLMHCDSKMNAWVRKFITYRLDKENLLCQRHVTYRSEPTFCPPPTVKWMPCDMQHGTRQLILNFYKRSHCHCIKQGQILAKPCGCALKPSKTRRKCDPIQGILQVIIHKYEWNDKSNDCVKVDQVKTVPVVCRPRIRIVRGKCTDGKLVETFVENIPDVNNCTCIQRTRTYNRDCRCPTEYIRIGNCSEIHAYWKELVLERRWDDHQQKCVVVKTMKNKYFCHCPPTKVNTECNNGVVIRTEVSFKLNKLTSVCHQFVRQFRYKPVCKETDGLSKSKQYQALFYRHLQTKCDRSTCTKSLETYANEYNPNTCKCGWKLVNKKRCTCCGCPKPHLSYLCENDSLLIVSITYYTTKQHRCGHECMRRVRTVKHQITCSNYSPPPQAYWSQCDNRTCQQSFITSVYTVKNCRCLLTKKVIDKRPCCCLKEEEKQTICKNGQLEIYTHRMVLENVRCVKSTTKQTVPIVCSKSVKIKYGECRPQTCRRPLFLITSVVDPDNCKCKKQQTIKEERECCCLGKPQEQKEFCVGNCKIVVKKLSKFDKVNERCVKENFIRRNCPKCPKPHVLEGVCDTAGTCLKTNRLISYTIKNCQCQPVEQIRHERCCCPGPKQLGSKCLEDKGIIENKNIYYQLENGHCVKRETIEKKQISCPQTIQQSQPEENQYCDPSSCQRIVTTYQWNRIGCKCIRQIITTPKLCCCTHRIPRVKSICLPDGSYKAITQLWKLDNGQCVKTSVVKNLPPPVCKPQDVTPIGPCDKTTGKQSVLITRSIVEECECKIVYREKRERICACQAPTVHVKPCDPNTCLQQITITKWAIEAKDKKCHRLHPDIKMRPCCCRREVMKNNLFNKCIPANGQIEITNRTYYFNPQKELCEFKDVKTFVNLVCPTEVDIVKGSCDIYNGIALDRITSWKKLISQCKCVQTTNYRKRVCSCKHLNEKVKNPICSKQANMLLQKKVIYELQNEICQPKVIWMKKDVVCPNKENVDVKCDPVTCNQLTIISWFKNNGCKCEIQQKFIQGKCCCPKPVEYRECQRGGSLLIIKKVSYMLDEDKGKCVSQIDQLRKVVVCDIHGPRFIKRVCDKQTCYVATILLKTVLQNCHCRRMMKKIIHRNIRCCCPNPRFQEKCHQNYGILSRIMYRYELFKKQCITRKFVDENKVVCPEEKVTRGQCDVYTKVRPVQRRSYSLIGCRCQLKIDSTLEPCTCPLPVIHKENCTAGKRSRKAWRIVYILRKNNESGKVTCDQEKEYLYEEPCHCDKDNRINESCQNGVRVVHKETNVFSQSLGRCVKSFVRSVHPVVCATKHQVVKSSGCVIERPDGIYFSEEILWEQVVNCKCVIKRRQILRLCACPKPTIKKQCLDTVNLAIYKNKFVNIGGQCIPDQEVITTETRCQEKAQIIDRSTCEKQPLDKFDLSKPPCLETLKISVPTVVNCQCQLKTIQIQRRCCTSPPKVKQICDPVKGRWVKVVESYVLSTGSILFKRDDLIVYDQIQKATSEQQDQTVVCPQSVSYENCDRRTGLLTSVKTYYKRIGCECKPIKEIKRGKCGCPPRRQWISQCKQNFRIRRTISYTFLNGTCIRQQQFGKQRCGCPSPMNRIYCDGDGRWVKCNTQYVYNPKTHACRLLKHCVRWYDECPRPTNRAVTQCNLQTQYKQLIQYVHFTKNKSTCKCDAIVRNEWTEYCGCDHLNRKVHRCLNHNTPIVDYLKYTLIKGDCVPKRLKYFTQLNCPRAFAQHYPCNNDQDSPDRGYSISKIRYFVTENCQCIPKEKIIRKLCNCTLIYPQMVFKRCYNNNRLLIRKKFSTLVNGKCLPSEAVYKKPINCQPLRRISVGQCQIGPDDVGIQRIDELRLTTIKCHCKWRIKRSHRKICKCPDPVKNVQCYNNGRQMKQITTIYSLDDNRCKASEQVLEIDPCARVKTVFSRRPMFQIGECNPVTCKAIRVDYRFFVENCQCKTQKKVTNEMCCCPKPITNQTICDPNTNIIIHKQIHYSLIVPTFNTEAFKSYCQPRISQISVQVKCGENLQRIRIKPCDGEYHIVGILKPIVENCVCKQKIIHRQKIRCGCPTAVRHVPGKCINQWAVHKWIGLNAVPTGINNSFQITEKSCKPVVMEERRIRCSCPPMQVFKKCLNHSLLVIQRVNYKLNKELSNCERYNTKEFKQLTCPKTQITQTSCGNKLENYEQVEVIKYWQPNQCNCLMRVMKNKWICNCHARYPNQVITKCLSNGYQRLTITKIWFNQGRQCLNRTEKHTETIACSKNLRIIRGQCNSTGHLELIYLQQQPQHCQCVWQKLTKLQQQTWGLRQTEACKCRPSFIIKRCHEANNNQTAYLLKIYIKYILHQGECRMYHKFEKNPVVCQVGSQLQRSQCDPINNERLETKIVTSLHGCECKQKIFKRRCRCNCPKPRTNAVCQSRDGLLRRIKVIHQYKDDQCTCEAKFYIQSSRVRCYEPPKLIKIGKCHKLPQNESIYVNKNDLYRNIFWSKLRRVGCQCQYQRFMEQTPCYCSPDIKEEIQCINDRILEIRRTGRKLSEDKKQCIRIVISKVRSPIHLGKLEYNRKCNPKTGIETVVRKLPYVENCKRRYRINVIHRKCKCNTKPRLIRQSQCSPECKVRDTWLMEKITPEGQCKFYYRVQEKSCCCPTEVNLGTFCNRSIGLLETGYRIFKLIDGKCVSKDRFDGKQIVCKPNERVVKHQQPNGWVRIEKQFNVRDGCNCVRKFVVDYDKWNCPPPVTQRRCVQANSEQFVLETVSTKWKLSDSKPICSRLDTIIDRVPIDCSEEYVNKSDKCVMNVGRHATVRIDQVTTFHADGCRCIENSMRQVFTVCKCLRPHREKSCLYPKGILIYQNVDYEVSGDKSRCLPRRSRRVVKITCSPVGPQYKGRTECDAETGNFYHLYEEFKRVGCHCLKKEIRIPGRCKCPEKQVEMRCSRRNVQQLNITTYELSPKGTCIKSDKLQYKYIKCSLADNLLEESADYRIQQSQSLIKHIYKCGSAGKCMRIIQEYKTYTNQKCKCITETKQYSEACCCPTEHDMIQLNLPVNSSSSISVTTQCDSDKGLILTNTIRWNLEHGKCWPVVHRTVFPVVCDRKEFFKPITVCRQGRQKNLHQREIREGCRCKLDKRIVIKPCACDPLGSADVVFLVDETVKSRQMNYSYYVKKVMKYTVNMFYESSQSSITDEQFRFGIIQYSLQARIVSSLRSYRGLYELYAEIKKLTFNGHQSDLRAALNAVKSQILEQIRPGTSLIIYIITDAIADQPTGVAQLADYLKSHNVQINIILLNSENTYQRTLFKQLVSPPVSLHLVRLQGTPNIFASHLSRISDTICKKVCPVNHKMESQCSRQTNCIGHIYNYVYRYNPVKGLCIGKTIVERKQCCCMKEVQRKTTCENNHLIQYTENWQLTSNGFCEQYVTRRDVTGLAISQCTPANQTFIKSCNIRGEAVQVTVYRYMKNCECKTKKIDKIVRCRCTKKHNTKTCFGDDLIVYHYHFERLLEGECLPQRRDVHKKLACKRPKIFKSPCDPLTCQQRVTIVNYVAQRCKCKRFVTVKHQTCCCKGNRTSNYVGCKHNDIKVFEEKIVDPEVHSGSCIQRVSYYFQPITCPSKPSLTYHSCRRFNVEAAENQGNYEIDKVDPGLIYRLVEKVKWKIQDCDCRRYYESYFEACGCDESSIISNSVRTKHKCDQQTGVLMTYRQKVRLEIVGIPHEYTKLNRLNKLSDAICRPHYVIEAARKIICPETKTSVGPCELAEDGRSYRAITVHRWMRSNCVCRNLPPMLIEKQVCSCLPIRLQTKCISVSNKLQIYVIKEKLIKTKLSSGKYKYECKIEQTMKENIIQCPKNILHYSKCKEGKMRVTVKIYKVYNCKCQESIRRLQVQCNKPERLENIKQLQPKASRQILTTVEQIIDCIDLLPAENCLQISRSSRRICEKSSQLSDLLCRRTCRRCLGCELNNIRYRMINANYPCAEDNQHVLKNFLIKSIPMTHTLASCKLACANQTNCLSFIYSMSSEFELNEIDKTTNCMLYRVDLSAIKQHEYEQHQQQQQNSIDIVFKPIEQQLDPFFSPINFQKCLAFRKICKHTCPSPKLTEISKCECKVYKNYYGYPSESSKFKTSLHCSKLISVQYYTQSKSGVCQKQHWQGYTPCSNPRYRDLPITNLNNCDNLKSTLWCEAELADDQRKCKDDVFSRLCPKTCGLCTCYGVNVFNGECNSTGYKLDTHIIYKSHPVNRICFIEIKMRLSVCEYCPIGTFEYVHKCNKLTRSRTINQITAQLITIPSKINGKPQFKCSIQTKNYKFECGKCLAAYRDKYSITSCKKLTVESTPMKSVYQLNLITEYVVDENGCCRTKRTERRFNCVNCPSPRIKLSPCYNKQRLKHIIFYTRPWVTSSLKPSECIQQIITKRERCSIDHQFPKDECRDSLTLMDCGVFKQSRKCHLNSEEARSLCAKTCGFCD
ncbi:unnamed protein product [Schistosoma turkestanicum]|nr:unnamed protein product [Schistosoma turkestanicum]